VLIHDKPIMATKRTKRTARNRRVNDPRARTGAMQQRDGKDRAGPDDAGSRSRDRRPPHDLHGACKRFAPG